MATLHEVKPEPAMTTLSLDAEQREAVEHAGSPLIVLAGPGSGKTRIIIARIARLLQVGAAPESILALTFTVKAAEELRTRLEDLSIPASVASRVRCRTFHSFGFDLLRRFHDLVGLPAEWRIIDSAERKRMLRAIVTEHDLFAERAAAGREGLLEDIGTFIEACRQAARTPGDAIQYGDRMLQRAEAAVADAKDEEARTQARAALEEARLFAGRARAYEYFEMACLERGCLTFDDFIALPIRLLQDHEGAAAIVRTETKHVLVDEFQDVNAAQMAMLRLVAPPRTDGNGPDLAVVGDDDQAIYGFRGSEPLAFEQFEETWPGTKTIALTTNYRSGSDIVDLSQMIIGEASHRFRPDKTLSASATWTAESPGGAPSVEPMEVSDNGLTGALIAAMIRADRAETERTWSQYAVIVRNNTPADVVAEELRLHNIPVDRQRMSTPADDPAVLDLLAWMHLLAGDDQLSHVHRLLLRPPTLVAPETAAKWLQRYRAQQYASREGERKPRTFIEWLRSNVSDRNSIERFLKRYDRLRKRTAGRDAARAAYDILRVTGILRHPARVPHESERAILNMAIVMSFIEDRLGALEAPGDLAAFVRHYEDMERHEQKFEAPHLDQLDSFGTSSEGSDVDAVTVVTAHKAKGLEFDTVFLPQVRKGGFPYRDRGGGSAVRLPEAFLGHPVEDEADEERRVFYVACTRAKRRLVLIAKSQKQKVQKDFFGEIKRSGLHPIDGDAFLAANAAPPPAYLQPKAPAPGPETALEQEADRVWEEAVATLHAAADGVEGASDLAALQDRLAAATASLAGLAHARDHGALSEILPVSPEVGERIEAILRGHPPREIFVAQTPPLNLSYSDINAYLQCPRCYAASKLLHFSEPSTIALALGNCVHGALEKFALRRAGAESEGLFV
ncbi:MAG: ATP-dependent helicase, partial [Phycisphaerales bacterium]|nr:ATP-dependent helicase [Phycisphaerales bacterium]